MMKFFGWGFMLFVRCGTRGEGSCVLSNGFDGLWIWDLRLGCGGEGGTFSHG